MVRILKRLAKLVGNGKLYDQSSCKDDSIKQNILNIYESHLKSCLRLVLQQKWSKQILINKIYLFSLRYFIGIQFFRIHYDETRMIFDEKIFRLPFELSLPFQPSTAHLSFSARKKWKSQGASIAEYRVCLKTIYWRFSK